ncbi:NPP1 family protein [Hyalangium minutum]|uniref:Uncharacterized protein n=1 Tax=Hyalangium minutum TaxID=394096 RepID=A0A085WIL2_9BACT|nr:NPP1 family protein [Hyalangium minutum]KFE67525.1 hypothetical protein DB31_8008 [Hyalangium minutum]
MLSLSALASGCGPLPETSMPPESPSQAQEELRLAAPVTIHSDSYYQGLSQTLQVGWYDIWDLTIGNDTLSSLRVPAGYKVTLYSDAYFAGEQRVYTQDTGWVGLDFNDLTSGVRVEQIGSSYALAQRFAPRLRFDGSGHGYPMAAQTFYDTIVKTGSSSRLENTDASTLGTGQIPTYYQVISCGAQVRIKYWWFYGYQAPCDGTSGSHNGDWENVVVTLSEDQSRIAAVTFAMHGKSYTRLANRNGFSLEEGTHPVVYVGKNSHAAFFEQGGSSTSCLVWEEYRNNSTGLHLNSWSNLVSLDTEVDPSDWIAADRQGGFAWGRDGVSTHPTQSGPNCSMKAAEWSNDVPTWWHSQCKTGDRDDGSSCHVQCRPGYTDMGLTCTNWSTWSTYNQTLYSYGYTLPTSNVGLLTNDYD